MNSTNGERTRRFFFEELMPAASELKAQGETFYPVGPEESAETYFVRREKTAVGPEDFVISEEDLRRACHPGTPGAEKLTAGLTELRETLYQREEQDHEVSPFIYIMF